MDTKRLLAWLLILAMAMTLGACAQEQSGGDVTEPLAGTYWIDSMTAEGNVIDRAMLEMMGMADSHLVLREDGSAVLQFSGKDPVELRYDAQKGILYDDEGSMEYTRDGKKLKLINDGAEIVFLKGEDAPETVPTEPTTVPTDPTTQPTDPTDDVTEPKDETTEPTDDATEPKDDPTEPEDDQPKDDPTEPKDDPTEPKDDPAQTQPTDPEEQGLEGKYWLYSVTSEGVVMNYSTLKHVGLSESYFLVRGDGTAQMYLKGEDVWELRCDTDTMTLTRNNGTPMSFSLDGTDVIIDLGDSDVLTFLREGDPRLG